MVGQSLHFTNNLIEKWKLNCDSSSKAISLEFDSIEFSTPPIHILLFVVCLAPKQDGIVNCEKDYFLKAKRFI